LLRRSVNAAIALLLAASANAQINGASKLLRNRDGGNQVLAGIGRLNASLTCTAFFLDTGARADAPAYVLANGHCISTNSANEVILDRAGGTLRVVFNYFVDTQAAQIPIGVRRIAYSTMKGLDVSVLELNATFGELRERGLTPLPLAPRLPFEVEPVLAVGAPNAGIPSDETFIRSAECTLGAPVDLIEFIWHFHAAYPNTCSDIKGGSSGTPLISQVTGEVVAIMNTTTAGALHETGDFQCFNGQPCEIAPGGGFNYKRDTNYALPLKNVQHCFSDGVFDVAHERCPLDPGRQFTVTLRQRAVRPPATWNATLTGTAWSQYRYKVVAEGAGDCRDSEGYGAPIAIAESSRIDDPLPEAEGRYHLCVIGGDAATWQDARFATEVHLRVDATPPTIPIEYLFRYQRDAYVVQPIFVVPELSGYRYRIGGPECEVDTGYSIYLRIPFRVPKDATHLCLRGQDDADNEAILKLPLLGLQVFPDGVRNAASLRTVESIAPGQLVALQGVNLEGATVTLRGKPQTVLAASEEQVDVRIAPDTATGAAELVVTGPAGSTSISLMVSTSSPGVFVESTPTVTVEESRFTLRTTGVHEGDVHADIGGVITPATVISEPTPGVQLLEVRLPAGFPLRGYVPVTLVSGGRRSQGVVVRFRD